jgi:hypothetical protein
MDPSHSSEGDWRVLIIRPVSQNLAHRIRFWQVSSYEDWVFFHLVIDHLCVKSWAYHSPLILFRKFTQSVNDVLFEYSHSSPHIGSLFNHPQPGVVLRFVQERTGWGKLLPAHTGMLLFCFFQLLLQISNLTMKLQDDIVTIYVFTSDHLINKISNLE